MTHSCPRKWEAPGYVPSGGSGGDSWIKRDGKPTCSYCGSLDPDVFMTMCRTQKQTLGPTDKNYKVYVLPHKFYFQHLDKQQMTEFVSLHNQGQLTIGDPGYFYVMPFFMRRLN